jgi:hypothetical protein
MHAERFSQEVDMGALVPRDDLRELSDFPFQPTPVHCLAVEGGLKVLKQQGEVEDLLVLCR